MVPLLSVFSFILQFYSFFFQAFSFPFFVTVVFRSPHYELFFPLYAALVRPPGSTLMVSVGQPVDLMAFFFPQF